MEDEKEKKEKEKKNRKKAAIEGTINISYLSNVMKDAKEAQNDDLEVKCFFFITFNTLLMASTQNDLDVFWMQAGMELERISKINWRKVVLNQLVQGLHLVCTVLVNSAILAANYGGKESQFTKLTSDPHASDPEKSNEAFDRAIRGWLL